MTRIVAKFFAIEPSGRWRIRPDLDVVVRRKLRQEIDPYTWRQRWWRWRVRASIVRVWCALKRMKIRNYFAGRQGPPLKPGSAAEYFEQRGAMRRQMALIWGIVILGLIGGVIYRSFIE